ncbi:unnamed protein product [Linum trigynum]|uniref:Uncharacterized protein n=1 Tax=Linum trigynum TaxID=586398 RepID=A0AAV2DM87_9ROSI
MALTMATRSGALRAVALRAATSRTDQANPIPTKATDEGKFTDGKGCGNRLGWGVEGGGARAKQRESSTTRRTAGIGWTGL